MKQERDINRLRNILRYIKVNVEPGKGIDKPISPTDRYHMHLLRAEENHQAGRERTVQDNICGYTNYNQ